MHSTCSGEGIAANAAAAACSAEHLALLRLLRLPGIGPARLRLLRAAFGSAEAALAADVPSFAAALEASEQEAGYLIAESRRSVPEVDVELGEIGRRGARLLARGDTDFPAMLLPTPDPPELLFVRGALGAGPEPAVAIVGSRRATAYGRLHAGRLASELAERGITVVSGGARGIDAEAHRGALRAGGRTVAVLASGLACPYPSEHAPLFDSIVDGGGAVLTEQPTFVGPRPDLFPRRNRIIAGLALVTIVVEAAMRSGALLTARLAVEDLSRDAGCLPGSLDSPWSAGCHRAIREGWAALVTGVDDVCEMLHSARSLVEGAGMCEFEPQSRDAGAQRRQRVVARERSGPRSPSALPAGVDRAHGAAIVSGDGREVLAALRQIGRGGLDELEDRLSRDTASGAWSVPRIAAVLLELEVGRCIERDAEGAWHVVGPRTPDSRPPPSA